MSFDATKELVSSRSNKVVKYLKSLSLARNRHREGRFLVESIRMVEDAVEMPGCVQKILVTPHTAQNERVSAIIQAARERGIEVMWVADRVIDYLSEIKTSQGIMALAKNIVFPDEALEQGQVPVVILAHMLQDPGNIGTIMRVAEAAGAGGLVITPGTVDYYNPKALRASMGSIFRLPTYRADSLERFVQQYKAKGYQVVAAMVSAKTRYFEADFTRPTVLLLGQEGSGLPQEACALADLKISIPMATMIDSLNVASAAAIILYEGVRQKYIAGGEFLKK